MFDFVEPFYFQPYETDPLDFRAFTSDQKMDNDEAIRMNKMRESLQRAFKSSIEFSGLCEYGRPYIEALLGLLSRSNKGTLWIQVCSR